MLHVDSPFNKKMKVILASLIITEVAEDNSLLIEKESSQFFKPLIFMNISLKMAFLKNAY